MLYRYILILSEGIPEARLGSGIGLGLGLVIRLGIGTKCIFGYGGVGYGRPESKTFPVTLLSRRSICCKVYTARELALRHASAVHCSH